MSIDIFGRQLVKNEVRIGSSINRGPPGDGFKINMDGNYDMDNKRLCNIGDPVDDHDAISAKFMRDLLQEQMKSMRHTIDSNMGMVEFLQNMMDRCSEVIDRMEVRLKTLEGVITKDMYIVSNSEISNDEDISNHGE